MLRTRFAPTPSGLLHPGNGASFVATWLLARAAGGAVVLRIDDLDRARRRDDYVEDIFRTLEWLGLDYDEGPAGPDDFYRHWSQHRRLDRYYAALEQLRQADLLYACRCSRREVAAATTDGNYPGTCRARGLGFDQPGIAWRVRVPAGATIAFTDWQRGPQQLDISGRMGDFVVRQKNELPAYQIASLVDDTDWRINFIVRGEDLLDATAAQRYLAGLLQRPAFGQATFLHHPLLREADGSKLSKSRGAGSLRAWRQAGRSPQPLYQMAARWLQLSNFEADAAPLPALQATLIEEVRPLLANKESG